MIFFTPTNCGFIVVGGGGGAYFTKKIHLSDFIHIFSSFLYIDKQDDVLISYVDFKIVYEFFIKRSEQLLFATKNIQLRFGFSVNHLYHFIK